MLLRILCLKIPRGYSDLQLITMVHKISDSQWMRGRWENSARKGGGIIFIPPLLTPPTHKVIQISKLLSSSVKYKWVISAQIKQTLPTLASRRNISHGSLYKRYNLIKIFNRKFFPNGHCLYKFQNSMKLNWIKNFLKGLNTNQWIIYANCVDIG